MTTVLLDTHAWAWSLVDQTRLSRAATRAIEGAGVVLVSPISVFEIAQKVRLGKWDAMAPFVDRLTALLDEQGGRSAGLDGQICQLAGAMSWIHRDPFDRLLAATALCRDVPIVSADGVFDDMVTRVW